MVKNRFICFFNKFLCKRKVPFDRKCLCIWIFMSPEISAQCSLLPDLWHFPFTKFFVWIQFASLKLWIQALICATLRYFDVNLLTICLTFQSFRLADTNSSRRSSIHFITMSLTQNLNYKLKKCFIQKVRFHFFENYLKSFLAWCQILKKYSSLRKSLALA